MKNNIISIIALVALAFTVSGCKAQANLEVCETGVTLLCDCTDKNLFDDVYKDLHDNLAVFFKNLGISQLNPNEKLTIRIGAIDDSGKLSLKSASIASASKRASQIEQKAKSNPEPLRQLISTELENQKQMCEREMKCSPIIDFMLKAFREMSLESNREVLVVCSDLVEFSDYANLYKSVPSTDEAVAKVFNKIDGILLAEAMDKISEVDPQVVFVLKANPKAQAAQLKVFYSKLMNKLGVNTISFVDNLSNNPNF